MVKKTLGAIYQQAKSQLLQSGIENYALDARLLVCHALNLSLQEFITNKDEIYDERTVLPLVERRVDYEPVSKIIGLKEFWSLPFNTNRHTLDPRADSETLIEVVLEHQKDKTQALQFLDLGTGTGCLLLSLLHEYPNATGVGVDISSKALKVAKSNAKKFDLEHKVNWIKGSWTSALSWAKKKKFDWVISNPPYISQQEKKHLPPEVLHYEPPLALFAENNGLICYKEIIDILPDYLVKNGQIVFEVGMGQAKDVQDLLRKKNFCIQGVKKDLAGHERAILALLQS